MAKGSELENQIIQILAQEPDGLKIAKLATAMNMDSDDKAVRKSLQRALKSLESQKKVEPKGQARARIYFITKNSEAKNKIATDGATSVINEIKLSKEGEKLLNYISQPIVKREPVGYNRKFLERYNPNKSSFLSPEEKKELMTMGQVEPSRKSIRAMLFYFGASIVLTEF